MLIAAIALLATAAPAPPAYDALAAGPARVRLLQGRPFWFTLGGGDDTPAHIATEKAVLLADRGLVTCGVGEWEYSFHHLLNGALDGAGQKHFGGYPTPPTTRAEAMDVVRRYYLRLRDIEMAKSTTDQRRCFVSFNGHYCYQHYACEWGCDVVGSEVGENINSTQMHIAFTRGAARQYGKPWMIDFSSWYGPSMYDEDPRKTWGEMSGPTHGHSMSLHARTYWMSYMAGANVVIAEGGSLNCFRSQTPGTDGTLPLSALGVEASRIARFTRRHPARGVAVTPVALVLPVDHGIYPGFESKVAWHRFPYTPGDQAILDALNVLYPGSLGDPDQPERADRQPGNPAWKDPGYMRTESLRLVASPHGDIADVLLANAPADVLRAYPALVLAGEYGPDPALAERLDAYLRQGGAVALDARTLASGALPAALAARAPTTGPDGLARVRCGRGELVVLRTSGPAEPTASRPLARFLAEVRRRCIPIDVTGRVETLFSRTALGWIVTIVNNEGVTKAFREPPVVDPKAAQTVAITWRGRGRVRRATLLGADADADLPVRGTRLTVPPGEVRVVQLDL